MLPESYWVKEALPHLKRLHCRFLVLGSHKQKPLSTQRALRRLTGNAGASRIRCYTLNWSMRWRIPLDSTSSVRAASAVWLTATLFSSEACATCSTCWAIN
jgi:hypothetical protein